VRPVGPHPKIPLLVLVALLWIGPARAALAEPPELAGDWYVLVHYRDTAGEDPDQLFWDDEVWRFEPHADGLRWTRHPHVTLRDDTGRTEKLPGGGEARAAGGWSPSPAQWAEIQGRLQVDGHEARSKTLRGSAGAGYRSRGGPRPGSASMVAYAEEWAIEGPADRPVFVRRDSLASGRADPAIGRTVFDAHAWSEDGRELRGAYRRDDRLTGEFRMLRIRIGSGR